MSNPILTENSLRNQEGLVGEPMTINGVVNKTLALFACLLVTSGYTWYLFMQGFMDKLQLLMMVGLVVGIVSFIVIMFNRKLINVMAPVYALSEGLVLGGITVIAETAYPGIAFSAVMVTFMALFMMLFLYKARIIKCSEKFRSVLMIAMFSILGIYVINLIGSFFHMQIPYLFGSGVVGIGFSVVVVLVAALNLIIDFDFIEQSAQSMVDKSYEWYGAFGLMVTLIWLYIEILNLLMKLRNRN